MTTNPQITPHLCTFTEEILQHFQICPKEICFLYGPGCYTLFFLASYNCIWTFLRNSNDCANGSPKRPCITKGKPKIFFKKSYFSAIFNPYHSHETDCHKNTCIKGFWLQPQSRT